LETTRSFEEVDDETEMLWLKALANSIQPEREFEIEVKLISVALMFGQYPYAGSVKRRKATNASWRSGK
jgi:hypothetical protein